MSSNVVHPMNSETSPAPAFACQALLPRVLFLIRSLNRGGAERQLLELVRELARRGFPVTVCTFYDGGALSSEARSMPGVDVISLGKRGRWDLLRLVWAVRPCCKAHTTRRHSRLYAGRERAVSPDGPALPAWMHLRTASVEHGLFALRSSGEGCLFIRCRMLALCRCHHRQFQSRPSLSRTERLPRSTNVRDS